MSLGNRTDLALLRLGGSVVEDHGDHLVVRTPHNPTFWWGNFLLRAQVPAVADTDRWLDWFAAEFPETRHVALAFDVIAPAQPRGDVPPAEVGRGLGADRRAARRVPGQFRKRGRPSRVRPTQGHHQPGTGRGRARRLAGTLVHEVSRHGFAQLGARTLVMVADPDYVAVRVYRAVGFVDGESQLQAERAPAP